MNSLLDQLPRLPGTILFADSDWLAAPLIVLLILVAVFLILIVLVQRGRGGGLTGALGGMGGQSAFGAKAGDTFTKITMWTALVWILLCIFVVKHLTAPTSPLSGREETTPATSGSESGALPPGAGHPAEGKPATGPRQAGGSGATAPAPKTTPATPPGGKTP